MKVGDKILKYEIISSSIGDGGTGKVFQAKDLATGKIVAIKAILPHLSSNQKARDRFDQEAEVLSRIEHPNVVKLINYESNENGVFLILEYVEGVPLDKYLKGFKGDREELAKKIVGQVLEGLSAAHMKGIYHRDIKPGNILVDHDEQVKIIDFGIAKMIDTDQNLAKTYVNESVGTPRYMSPEQVSGLDVLDHRTDIYSTGIVLHEILTGQIPYEKETHEFQVKQKIVSEELARPTYLHPSLDKRWDDIVKKATEKDKKNRYPKASVFRKYVIDATVGGETFSFKLEKGNQHGYYIKLVEPANSKYKEYKVIPNTEYAIQVDEDLLIDKASSNTPTMSIKRNSKLELFILFAIMLTLSVAVVWFIVANQNLQNDIIELNKELDYYRSLST